MWSKEFPSPKSIRPGQHLSLATEFKKGIIPTNKLRVGTITIRIDKNARFRKWIKTDEPNIWMPYATFVWIQFRGEIPKGFMPHHLDGNTLNDEINNLSLESRSSHINHHRLDLLAAKVGLKLPDKNIFCKICDKVIIAKKIGTFCKECRDRRRKYAQRAYKQQIRDRNRSEWQSLNSRYWRKGF